jgi:hypothetical protein
MTEEPFFVPFLSHRPMNAPSRPASLDGKNVCTGRFKHSSAIALHKSWKDFQPSRCKSHDGAFGTEGIQEAVAGFA